MLLVVWLVHRAGQGIAGAGVNSEGAGTGLAVTFVTMPDLSSHRLANASAVPMSTKSETPESADTTTQMEASSEQVQRVTSPVGAGVSDGSRPSTPSTIIQTASSAAASNTGGAPGDDLRASYHAALRAAIERTWSNLTSRRFPADCTLQLSQTAGGVVTATSAAKCSLSREDQLQLESAALMAQPLPYSGYESVFATELDLSL